MRRILCFFSVALMLSSCHSTQTETTIGVQQKDAVKRDTVLSVAPGTIKDTATNGVADTTADLMATNRCAAIAEKLMMSSSTFNEVKKERGDRKFGWFEPDVDSSAYTFKLFEDMGDHTSTLAFIVVDLKRQQVYHYDVVADSDIAVTFDRSLLRKIPQGCR